MAGRVESPYRYYLALQSESSELSSSMEYLMLWTKMRWSIFVSLKMFWDAVKVGGSTEIEILKFSYPSANKHTHGYHKATQLQPPAATMSWELPILKNNGYIFIKPCLQNHQDLSTLTKIFVQSYQNTYRLQAPVLFGSKVDDIW